jgi:hypothetical protein
MPRGYTESEARGGWIMDAIKLNLGHIQQKLVESIRHRDYKTNLPGFVWFFAKFCIYGCFGMVNELIFTNFLRIINKVDLIRFLFLEFINMTFPHGIPNDQMSWPPQPMFSMTSFWLFFVYGFGFYLVEKIYHCFAKNTGLVKNTRLDPCTRWEIGLGRGKRLLHLLIRLATYTIVICLVEFIFGWFYRAVFGFFVWEYPSSLRTTSLAVFPFWFGIAYLVELIVKKFGESDLEEAFLDNDDTKLSRILSCRRARKVIIFVEETDSKPK